MNTVNQTQFLMQVLNSNKEAVQFCEMIFGISQVLDDLVDQDKEVSCGKVIQMVWDCLIEVPESPFYQRHKTYLHPLLASALQDWTDSVNLERNQNDHGKHLAFVLRDQLTGMVIQCARLVGGYQWMQQVSAAIRLFFHDEPLMDYMAEFTEPQPPAASEPVVEDDPELHSEEG